MSTPPSPPAKRCSPNRPASTPSPDGSPAAHAGLTPGDRLRRVGEQARVLTLADLQWALHRASPDGTTIPVTFVRDGATRSTEVELEAGWKRGSVAEYAWRPYKWALSPAPGFGGDLLTPDERKTLGLDEDAFGLRVTYIVNWGEKAHRGRAVQAAGLRNGDVVLAFAGRTDFPSVAWFHAWVRLTRTAGDEVEIEILRDGKRRTLRYRLPR